jgi:hypothetical protein
MTRIEIKSRVGPDGVLDVKVPVGPEEANREVMITVQPLSTPAGDAREDDWQKFIDETYGSCAGLGLEEPADLPLQKREW